MQSSVSSPGKPRRKSSIIWLPLIIILSCLIGFVLGVGSVLVYQQFSGPIPVTENSAPIPLSLPNSNLVIPSDGLFIVNNKGDLTRIPEFANDDQLDISNLPSTTEKRPTVAVRGDGFPLGNLKILGYLAGIGVDLTFAQSGATINNVFEDSPAQKAGMQPGELIVALNGEPLERPMAYTPGLNDLIGLMQDEIELKVVAGTTSRTVKLPRTYRRSVINNIALVKDVSIPFSIETNNDYVLLHTDKELEPGVYRLEFIPIVRTGVGPPLGVDPTPTPSPLALPVQKWIFVVR